MSSIASMRVIVVGSGVAGLTCALSLIEQGHEVTIVTKSQTSDSATWYAQGGVASVMFSDDTPQSHIDDTMTAGVGLCNLDAVEVLVNEGADAVRRLISRGAQFDTLADGSYARTREGGHNNSRIIHAGGDATGEEIERSLITAAADESLTNLRVIDYHMVTKLLVDHGRCVGVECIDVDSTILHIMADAVVLATGGAGQLYSVTTNPLLATGDGVALALNANVMCADLEFMQFHPTALHIDNMPRPLLSEALRGEGAVLRDENGYAFMADVHEMGDLTPRDIVSREIARILNDHEIDNVFLDATSITNFSERFPTIYASCKQARIDPSREYLPVSPAAHYFCGGIATDLMGATSLPGLWAAGEVASNGVHGANRLASNSLLEGLVFGERVARAIAAGINTFSYTGMLGYLQDSEELVHSGENRIEMISAEHRLDFQKLMTRNVGVLRDALSLEEAQAELKKYLDGDHNLNELNFANIEMSHLVLIAQSLISSALARQETRGCHARRDCPDLQESYRGHFFTNNVRNKPVFLPMKSER